MLIDHFVDLTVVWGPSTNGIRVSQTEMYISAVCPPEFHLCLRVLFSETRQMEIVTHLNLHSLRTLPKNQTYLNYQNMHYTVQTLLFIPTSPSLVLP